jgi:wyosine [tRNA(Phe)-imidazoG37] synthetase (radical SAM superfamily)
MKYKHLFGPVISRRLGISLGVDVIPYKYCSMDCVYCEVGKTTNLIQDPIDMINLDELLAELDDFLSTSPKLDYITFSGAGEPLLYKSLGRLITHIKTSYPQYKLALITNSTHLDRADIIEELLKLDLVMPSMDAIDQDNFDKINRTHKAISVEDVMAGLISFSRYFKGEMWLEIFIVPGINDTVSSLVGMADFLSAVQPERVQLNSLDRPGTEAWVTPASYERLEEIKSYLQENLAGHDMIIEIIKKVDKSLYDNNESSLEAEDKILSTINRRPCTAQDLSQMLNLHINEVNKVLHKLLADQAIIGSEEDRGIFYQTRKEEN